MSCLLKSESQSEDRHAKWSLWVAFCGVNLSVIGFVVENFYSDPRLLQTIVGLYGLTFYALVYHFNPFLTRRLGMPWRTSMRVYLLLLLVGATAMKLGGEQVATLFICACAAIGVLAWRQYSIVQTIVMLIQLVLGLVVYFLVPLPLMWIIGIAVASNGVAFLLESNLRDEREEL